MKPKLRMQHGLWFCQGQGYSACAFTAKVAYRNWLDGFRNMLQEEQTRSAYRPQQQTHMQSEPGSILSFLGL